MVVGVYVKQSCQQWLPSFFFQYNCEVLSATPLAVGITLTGQKVVKAVVMTVVVLVWGGFVSWDEAAAEVTTALLEATTELTGLLEGRTELTILLLVARAELTGLLEA
jgi:hypothetical protein